MEILKISDLDLYVFKAYCTYVVDGDTVDLQIDLGFDISIKKRVRLLRIDTPERGKEGFTEAKLFVATWLLNKECFVQTYKNDNFGRYLAEIYLIKDDELINLNDILLDLGYAELY